MLAKAPGNAALDLEPAGVDLDKHLVDMAQTT